MVNQGNRNPEHILCAENISISSGDTIVIDEYSFTLDAGETGLVKGGPGSGKTALGLACCGLLGAFDDDATVQGTISLSGNPVAQGTIGPSTGVVLENPYAQISGMKRTVADELAFSLECRGVNPDEISLRVSAMLEHLGLAKLADHPIDTLSGGELQRIIIGATLITEPRFIFLDRPLTELDRTFRSDLLILLTKHCKTSNGAVLVADDPWLLDETVFDRTICLGAGDDVEIEEPLPVFSVHDRGAAVLSIEDITFSYEPEEPLIGDFSLTLPHGGLHFIEGANGAGKTTLAKLVTGLLQPDAGRIILDTTDVGTISFADRIRRVGFAPQNPGMVFCRKTVREELHLAAKWGHDPFMLVTPLGLDRVLDQHPLELSRAMQKRLGIALAYGPKRNVIILDEPSQYQDQAGFTMVAQTIDMMTREGAGVMIISHDPRFSKVFPDAPVTRLVQAGTD